jgi:hypothetical protein
MDDERTDSVSQNSDNTENENLGENAGNLSENTGDTGENTEDLGKSIVNESNFGDDLIKGNSPVIDRTDTDNPPSGE